MNPEVKEKFDAYPDEIKSKLLAIRAAIFEVAEKEKIGEITETLKWGEPSYVSKKGSAIRMDWKPKSPDQFSVFFNCNTKLVDTFKEVHKDSFKFVGNREIVFSGTDRIPFQELKECISMALRYHQIKHLPLLGA